MIVKKFSHNDIEARVSWINNPAINESMYFELPATIEKTHKWYDANLTNETRQDFSFFYHGKLVAMGGLVYINKDCRHAELYIMVAPDAHGKGWGSKSTKWLLYYAFHHLDLNKVYLYTDGNNINGYKLYESIGMTHEGTLRQHKLKDGMLRDRRIYSTLASEWKSTNYVETFRYEA